MRHPKTKSTVLACMPPGEKLDEIWEASTKWREISGQNVIDNALSGDDVPAAKSFVYWLEKSIRERTPLQDDVREYALAALQRAKERGVPFGQAFGLERAKRGNPRNRLGAMDAIIGLIRYLHDELDYSLGESGRGPNAFDVASALLERKWKWKRSSITLRDYWANKKGENS